MTGPADTAADDFATSPFGAFLGLRRLEWRQGFARIGYEVAPDHLNRSGTIHGGMILMLLDEVGGLAGAWPAPGQPRRRSVTVTLTSSFTGRVSGDRVVATGQVASHGRSLFFCRSEIHDANGALVAFASSTHRWRGAASPDA